MSYVVRLASPQAATALGAGTPRAQGMDSDGNVKRYVDASMANVFTHYLPFDPHAQIVHLEPEECRDLWCREVHTTRNARPRLRRWGHRLKSF